MVSQYLIETVLALLREGKNSALRYLDEPALFDDLAKTIIEFIDDQAKLIEYLPIIKILNNNYDYRLVAEYLNAQKNENKKVLAVFQQILSEELPQNINKLRYQLAYTHFINAFSVVQKANVVFVHQLNEIFSLKERQLVIFLLDNEYKIPLTDLIEDVGAMLGKFIEQQFDLPGENAVVRQGIVREWFLPNGTKIVSKRENPQKKGRFQKEQNNYTVLRERLGNNELILSSPKNPEDKLVIQIAQPFAIIYDGYCDDYYSLSIYRDGVSLEDIFLTKFDNDRRNRHLVHYRLLLDKLFEYGILWGDMSPRNILITQNYDYITYTLLDFEKTSFITPPISIEQRIEHCRGQVCVEELGVLCSLEEVTTCFDGYFDPSSWDLESRSALSFHPRPEIADILHGRGIGGNEVTLGTYNKIDKAIMDVRMPYINPQTKKVRFPGHLGFKVEHYLSCSGNAYAGDYDRKTTEVLIAAKKQDLFDDVVTLLAEITNAVEEAFLKIEFTNVMQKGYYGNVIPPSREIEILINVLDDLYQNRSDNNAFTYKVSKWRSMSNGEPLNIAR